jgi:hypothetical protein
VTRHYTITVEVPDDVAPGDPWVFVRAALEALEPGAARHCLRITQMQESTSYHHTRLDATIGVRVVDR